MLDDGWRRLVCGSVLIFLFLFCDVGGFDAGHCWALPTGGDKVPVVALLLRPATSAGTGSRAAEVPGSRTWVGDGHRKEGW